MPKMDEAQTQELIQLYEETYKPPDVTFIEPKEPLVDEFLIQKIKNIRKKMSPKSQGGMETDWWTVIVGGEGTGKSTFASGFLYHYSKISSLDFPSAVSKNTAFDEFDIMRTIANLDINSKYSFLWADEGSNIFFNRDSMSKTRKYSIKFANAMRFLHYFVAICAVELAQLDTVIRNHRVKTLIRIEKQGVYHYYNYTQMLKLLWKNRYKRDQDFNWYSVQPEHVGWFKHNDNTKQLVDALKRQYLVRFQMEVQHEYKKMLKQKVTDMVS